MATLFTFCAVAGSVVLIVQLAIAVFGADADIDTDFDADVPDDNATIFFGVFSIKAIVAALAFFGLGGLAGHGAGFSTYGSILAGLLPAAVAMIGVAWLMRLLHSFDSHGNVDIRNAIGVMGTVYLTVPGARDGAGKVTVTVQGRTMEYPAVTAGAALPTGTAALVVDAFESGTLEVQAPLGEKE